MDDIIIHSSWWTLQVTMTLLELSFYFYNWVYWMRFSLYQIQMNSDVKFNP